MTQSLAAHRVATAADGVPLATKLRRAERLARLRAYGLLLPLFAFIFVTFFAPILVMLFRSVENPQLASQLPEHAGRCFEDWDPAADALPAEAVFAAFAAELAAAREAKTLGQIATRAELRAVRHPLAAHQDRPPARQARGPAGGRRQLAGHADRHRRGLGRARDLGDDQELRHALHARLLSGRARPALRHGRRDRRSSPRAIGSTSQVFLRTVWLSALVTALCLAARLPGRLSARDRLRPAPATCL